MSIEQRNLANFDLGASEREWKQHNRSLFEIEEVQDGERYQAIFKGRAYILHVQDEGVFLSDMSDVEYRHNEQAMIDGFVSDDQKKIDAADKASEKVSARRLVDVKDLFPSEWEWSGNPIEYEITVRARKIEPNHHEL